MAFFVSDSLELAGAPLWHLGTHRPPPGRMVTLSGEREIFVRESGASRRFSPPVLLLHGWFASGGLNWIRAFEPLSKHHRICAPDLQGHASSEPDGPKHGATRRFTIERCADDMAELLNGLFPGEPALVIGYSLGGMVAQALWRRHPQTVAGLVLGATSAAPVPVSRGRRPFAGMMNAARESSLLLDRLTRTPRRAARRLQSSFPQPNWSPFIHHSLGHWAPSEFTGHHWPTVLDTGRAIAEFDAREWIGEVDVPTSVILTERDSLIPPAQQHAMASAIENAHLQTIDAGHFACIRDDFGSRLLDSCHAVTEGFS